MHKILSIIFIAFLFVLVGCDNDDESLRVEKLGKDIYNFALKGDYDAELPKDLVFIGNNTFWKLLEINQPIESIKITIHESGFSDDRADYQIDFGTFLGLKIRYDSESDKFHVVGYQAAIRSVDEDKRRTLTKLNQNLYKVGDIIPSKGVNGMIVKESLRNKIFENYNEKEFNRLGLFFEFQNDILDRLYISKYQLETKEGIGSGRSSKREIIEAYGEPKNLSNSVDFLDKRIKSVENLSYEGISFILLKEELMLIIVE